MAVIEISKIQVRRGQENQTGVPPLDGGEFAWAADTENLYIGLRRDDGGARDANVRILTENDLRNFFNASGSASVTDPYSYRSDTVPPITAFYTTGTATAIVRSISQKADDIVSIKDFFTYDDYDSTATTAAIQLAVNRLFLTDELSGYAINTGTTPAAKALYFPAGHYNVNSTIFLPANATLIGEGIDKTVITRITTGTDVSGLIFQTVDKLNNPEMDDATDLVFDHFDNTPIAFNEPASNILIQGMTLNFDPILAVTGTNGLVSLDCADHSIIREVKFQGNMNSTSSNKSYVGINLRGYSAVTTNHIVIEKCEMQNLHSGIKSDYDVNHILIKDNYFTDLEKGINFNDPVDPLASVGPKNIIVENNKFYKINQQALYAGTSTSATNYISAIVSKSNTYINVGNIVPSIGETYGTGTAVITFASMGNSSVNDYFGRQEFQDISGGSYWFNDIIEGKAVLDNDNTRTMQIVPASSATIMRLPITGHNNLLEIKYACTTTGTGFATFVDRAGIVTFNIVPNPNNVNDPDVQVVDNYNFGFGDGALYWGAEVYEQYSMVDIKLFNPGATFGGSDAVLQVTTQAKLLL